MSDTRVVNLSQYEDPTIGDVVYAEDGRMFVQGKWVPDSAKVRTIEYKNDNYVITETVSGCTTLTIYSTLNGEVCHTINNTTPSLWKVDDDTGKCIMVLQDTDPRVRYSSEYPIAIMMTVIKDGVKLFTIPIEQFTSLGTVYEEARLVVSGNVLILMFDATKPDSGNILTVDLATLEVTYQPTVVVETP